MFDPVDEKLENVELKETVPSQFALVPACPEADGAEEPAFDALTDANQFDPDPDQSDADRFDANESEGNESDGLDTEPWKRRRESRKAFLTWQPNDLENRSVFAGLGLRACAHVIDWSLITVVCVSILMLTGSTHLLTELTGIPFLPTTATLAIGFFQLGCLIVGVSTFFPFSPLIWTFLATLAAVATRQPHASVLQIIWLFIIFEASYYAVMESSDMQATIGKKIMKVYVTDTHGKRLELWQAYARYFAKIICFFTMAIGYIAIFMTKNKQGFHDRIARTYVLRNYDPKLLGPRFFRGAAASKTEEPGRTLGEE